MSISTVVGYCGEMRIDDCNDYLVMVATCVVPKEPLVDNRFSPEEKNPTMIRMMGEVLDQQPPFKIQMQLTKYHDVP